MEFKITQNFEWSANPSMPRLMPNTIHVWRTILPVHQDIRKTLEKNLSLDEKHRANTFRFAADAETFIVARGVLRDIIARYINVSPQDILFKYTKFGKPYLSNSNISFNLSHSGRYVLYAITENADIGIDVEECKDNIEFLLIAKEFLSKAEYNQFLIVSPEEKCLAFYQAWTRKEAILKAMGKGLQFPTNQLEVSFLPSEAIKVKKILGYPSLPKLFQIPLDENYVSAVAVLP